MTSRMSTGDSGAAAGTSALAPGLADTKHGSAAGSVPRAGHVATPGCLATTPRNVSPLGQGNINDDALPAGKRRVVSREPPAQPPGVILQAVGVIGAADRSFDLSSDDSMPADKGDAPDGTLSSLAIAQATVSFSGPRRFSENSSGSAAARPL